MCSRNVAVANITEVGSSTQQAANDNIEHYIKVTNEKVRTWTWLVKLKDITRKKRLR